MDIAWLTAQPKLCALPSQACHFAISPPPHHTFTIIRYGLVYLLLVYCLPSPSIMGFPWQRDLDHPIHYCIHSPCSHSTHSSYSINIYTWINKWINQYLEAKPHVEFAKPTAVFFSLQNASVAGIICAILEWEFLMSASCQHLWFTWHRSSSYSPSAWLSWLLELQWDSPVGASAIFLKLPSSISGPACCPWCLSGVSHPSYPCHSSLQAGAPWLQGLTYFSRLILSNVVATG